MEIIIGGRQSGRTTKCIEWAAEHDAYIVCSSIAEADRIANQARQMGLNIRHPVTFSELPMRGAYPARLVIDNVDWMIRSLVGPQHTIEMVTFEAPAPTKEQS